MLKNCPNCEQPFYAPPSGSKYCSRQCYDETQSNKVSRTCLTCGKEFLARAYSIKTGGGLYCSNECKHQRDQRQADERICPACGKSFYKSPSSNAAYCSRKCSKQATRQRHTCTCEVCGKTFHAAPAAKRKFCSRKCMGKHQRTSVERICERCGQKFLVPPNRIESGRGRFCSRTCADGGWDEPCEQCGKMVHRTPSHAEKFKHVFCSRECYSSWNEQKVEHICPQCGQTFQRKQSETESRYCSQVCYDVARVKEMTSFTCEQCGKPFTVPAWYLKQPQYKGKFCSNTCQGLARRMPDSARSEYSHEFTESLKEEIRQRDDHACQLCGKPQGQEYRALAVHHIDYDKTNNHPDNLIALCHSCHSKTNYDRGDWEPQLTKQFPD